jgi:hypothetical protein
MKMRHLPRIGGEEGKTILGFGLATVTLS